MQLKTRTWFLLSLLFLAAAIFFWLYGNRVQARKNAAPAPTKPAAAGRASASFQLLSQSAPLPFTAGVKAPSIASVKPASNTPAPAADPQFPHRLRNTARPLGELAQSETAVLLRNAFIDTASPLALSIPEHLRADAEAGSYVVQSRGLIDEAFRARMREAGAEIVSYIPNNAYLVRASAAQAQELALAAETRAVLPFHPYYKLDSSLLPLAVEQKAMPENGWLRVMLFPGQREAGVEAVKALGGEIIQEEPSPFGPQLLVRPGVDSLPAIARLAEVQGIEAYRPRAMMSDRTRVVVGVTDNFTNQNYLNLSGNGITINFNDTGVDGSHPDLAGRVRALEPRALRDTNGHGTHVASLMVGNGSQWDSVSRKPRGSPTNAIFQGIAPDAELFVLPTGYDPEVHAPVTDTFFAETAAAFAEFGGRTNAGIGRVGLPLISNNSWGYPGATDYDSSAARFDAAVRDGSAGLTNQQPIIYVFAGGNEGNGGNDGLGGDPNSITSPANAKNVITIGASESFRNITNLVVVTNLDGTLSTNELFLSASDSETEIASFSSRGNVGIGTEGQFGRFKPDVIAPGAFVIGARSAQWPGYPEDSLNPDIQVLRQVNEPLQPSYRFDSGTSQAAGVVSGLLALMQEFFEQRLPENLRRTNSPAMMKALLINGARNVGGLYDFQVENNINYQGWGMVNLSNSVPSLLLSESNTNAWPLIMLDQSAANSIATGETRSWDLNLSSNAISAPLRVTLVWTDPPGNPNAAIKLVNDLDLVVSNTVTKQVYYGNNIGPSGEYNQAAAPEAPPVRDAVNNVENVFIREPGDTNWVVSVIARRVNVTAASEPARRLAATNDVLQDFALVIATGDQTIPNAFSITPFTNNPVLNLPLPPTRITNGLPLLNQRVGANTPLSGARDGVASQWSFYIFTNIFLTNEVTGLTNGSNVAFITFSAPSVGRPRTLEGDLDLYVSGDPGLLRLESGAVGNAFKSVTRGGTESVVFTNATIGQIFYIAVKSEDQQAVEFGIVGLSSDLPFEETVNGQRILRGFPFHMPIPDGASEVPGAARIFAVGITPQLVQRVIVTNILSHDDMGDLIGTLTHSGVGVVLNNHNLNNGFPEVTNAVFVYDDDGFGTTLGSQRTDGPGSLRDFAGLNSSGVWILTMVDNAPTHVGFNESLTLRVDPLRAGNLADAGPNGVAGTVEPNSTACYFTEVPLEATNMIVRLSQMTGPLDVFIRREALPTPEEFDKFASVTPPGADINLGIEDSPNPLTAGRYYICLRNSSAAFVNFRIATIFQLGLNLDTGRVITETNALTIFDQNTLTSIFEVPVDKQLDRAEVSVRIDHPRPSDLVLHLTSPQGTRVLLAENRGGLGFSGYGTGLGTNIAYTVFTEDTNRFKEILPVKFSTPPYTNLFGTNAPIFEESFERSPPGIYKTNELVSGWTVTSGQVQLHSATNALGVTAHSGTNFLELDASSDQGAVLTTFNTVPGTDYVLSFFAHRNPAARPAAAQSLRVYVGPVANVRPPSDFVSVPAYTWQRVDHPFTATTPVTAVEIGTLTSAGPLIDSVSLTRAFKGTNTYVLPEESMQVLKGQRTHGQWKLEVWDNRAGPGTGGSGSLLGWELSLKYANPQPRVITLTNNLAFSGALTNRQTNFFLVDVCDNATRAVVSVSGPKNKLRLLVDRSGLPTGDPDTDDFFSLLNDKTVTDSEEEIGFDLGFAFFDLRDNPAFPAPLPAGRPFYLAVHNDQPGETNAYTITVRLDRDDCHGDQPVIRLVDNVFYTNAIPPGTGLLDYYVFDVHVAAEQVDFELFPQNGDLGLVARYGRPLPDRTTFDYLSDNPGSTLELITLKTNSTPIPLLPGDWFLGVYNPGPDLVLYTIRARQKINTNINIIPLTNAVPLDFTIGGGSQPTNFFWLAVTNPAPEIHVVLTNLTGDADLLVGFNRLPPYTNAPPRTNSLTFSGSPTNAVDVFIPPQPPATNVAGGWYFAVIPRGTNDLKFTLLAEVVGVPPPPTGSNIVVDAEISVSATNICLTWKSVPSFQYRVRGRANVEDPNWVDASPTITASLPVTTYCIDFPTPFRFFIVEQLGTNVPPPPPSTNVVVDASIQFTGTNICLTWDSIAGAQYQVQGRTNIEDTLWADASPVITAAGSPTTYCLPLTTPFRFFHVVQLGTNVPPPPPPPATNMVVESRIEFTGTNLCLTWVSVTGSQYQVQGRTNIEDTIWADASPVITAAGSPTTYCLPLTTPFRFFQVVQLGTNVPPPPPPPSTNVVVESGIEFTGTNLCLTWVSVVGAQYQVQGRTNIEDTLWADASPVITAAGSPTTYCLPLTTPFRFFQVVQLGTNVPPPPPPPPPATNMVVQSGIGLMDTNICVVWDSVVGAQYQVQGRTNIDDTLWIDASPVITATATNSNFCLPLTTPFHFFQVIQLGTNAPPPPPVQGGEPVPARLTLSPTQICLSWASSNSVKYRVDGKIDVVAGWTNIANGIMGSAPDTIFCTPLPSPYFFFRVVTEGGGSSSGGGSTNEVKLLPPMLGAGTEIEFSWAAVIGGIYEVQIASNLGLPNAWTALTNITASAATVTFKDTSATNSALRFYRVIQK